MLTTVTPTKTTRIGHGHLTPFKPDNLNRTELLDELPEVHFEFLNRHMAFLTGQSLLILKS